MSRLKRVVPPPTGRIKKSVLDEVGNVSRAIELINLGARLHLLQDVTTLSRQRLIKLYKEVRGVSPAKGQLPHSPDHFITWAPNVHASLFMNIHLFVRAQTGLSDVAALAASYRAYLQHIDAPNEKAFNISRAWLLVKLYAAGSLHLMTCTRCAGRFIERPDDLHQNYICRLCAPPSRAGAHNRKKVVAFPARSTGRRSSFDPRCASA